MVSEWQSTKASNPFSRLSSIPPTDAVGHLCSPWYPSCTDGACPWLVSGTSRLPYSHVSACVYVCWLISGVQDQSACGHLGQVSGEFRSAMTSFSSPRGLHYLCPSSFALTFMLAKPSSKPGVYGRGTRTQTIFPNRNIKVNWLPTLCADSLDITFYSRWILSMLTVVMIENTAVISKIRA